MKTYKNLYEEYVSDDNIITAMTNAKSGNKAKRTKQKIESMLQNKDRWIASIRQMLPTFVPPEHKPKVIYDGVSRKKRTIIVPSVIELIIQHMQINLLKSIIFKGLYEHSYAAIPKRGTHVAKKRISKWIREDKVNTSYCLKLDVRHFFESVDIDTLKKMLSGKIKDELFLQQLFVMIDVSQKGIPLGFYTSQWYANWYMQDFDHYVKEELGAKYYVRYMDDLVIFSGDKSELHIIRKGIEEYLEDKLNLSLKPNYQIIKISDDDSNSLDFAGFRFYSNRTTLRKSILFKATRKARKISKKKSIGRNETVHDARQMMAYKGWLSASDSYIPYTKHIKPKISFRELRKVISRHDKKRGEIKCGIKQKVEKDLPQSTQNQASTITTSERM